MAAVLPVPKEIRKLSRQYIGNVIYTLTDGAFTAWVRDRMDERNRKITESGNQLISMDPQIANIFAQSTSVSGNYHFSIFRRCAH